MITFANELFLTVLLDYKHKNEKEIKGKYYRKKSSVFEIEKQIPTKCPFSTLLVFLVFCFFLELCAICIIQKLRFVRVD